MFKPLLIAACIALPLTAVAAEEKKPTPQQQKMAVCNKSAGDKSLEGDARKAFMKECLSAGGGAEAKKSSTVSRPNICRSSARPVSARSAGVVVDWPGSGSATPRSVSTSLVAWMKSSARGMPT